MERWRAAAILGGLAAMLGCASLSRAQAPTLIEQKDRLEQAMRASKAAQTRSESLERAADTARDQAARARAHEAAAAERIKQAQADILAARARIDIADRLLAAQRIRVAERQGPTLRLIAALQSMARRPAALALVQPGSTEDIVHVRAVLGTVMPVVRRRTADVRAELERIRSLRGSALAAVASLREGRNRLEAERIGLVRLEARHRLRSRQLDRSAMVESDRAIALGERARDILDQLETMDEAAELGAELKALPGPLPRPAQSGDASGTSARTGSPPYRLPVAGQMVTGLGELSGTGVHSRGITLATAPGIDVIAPAGGQVVYAAGFRDYGGIVILDHGRGWTSLITGLGTLTVQRGETIAQGRLIGRTSRRDSPRVTIELRRRGQPIDLTRLLGPA